jgi:hypothetical protein
MDSESKLSFLREIADPKSVRFLEIAPCHVVRLFYDTDLGVIIINQGKSLYHSTISKLPRMHPIVGCVNM